MELLDTRPALATAAPVIKLPPRVTGAIRFDEVAFAYPDAAGDHRARARCRSRSIPASAWRWSVRPGAGKSTVFALILRFYDPSSGRILLDGADIRHCDPHDLRRAVALVPQDPVIFAASVTENVRFGRPGRLVRGGAGGVRRGARAGVHRAPAAGLRHRSRRARREALRRPAPAHLDRARDPRRPPDPAARRGDQLARRRERAPGRAGARAARARAHHARHRASPRDRAPRRPHHRARPRPHPRRRARTTSCCAPTGSTRTSRGCSSLPRARSREG